MAKKTRLPIGERVKTHLLRHSGNAEQAVIELLTAHDRVSDQLRTLRDNPASAQADPALRAENERLEDENARLTGLIPAAGAVVLSADDAAKWAAFTKLGKKPEEIEAALKKTVDLEGQIATRDRNTSIAEAATLGGFKPSVLTDIANRAGAELHIELRDVTEKVDGKDVQKKVPHVRKRADDKAQLEPLATYLDRECKDYLPALKAAESTAATSTSTGTAITPFPVQAAAGATQSSGDPVTDHINRSNTQRAARANPLFPGRPAAVAAK